MSFRRVHRFHPPPGEAVDDEHSHDRSNLLSGGIGAAGGVGIWSLLGALFARGNATETIMLLLYGIMIESGRRIFNWLSERVLIKPSITAVFREGDPAYEWIMLYLTQENVWRKSRVFEVSAKSTKRKWHINASSYFPSTLPGVLNADYVPNWSTPHMFSYRGYYVDVVKSGHDVGGMGGNRMGYGMYPVGGGSSIRLTFFTGLRIKMTVLSDFVEECRTRYLESNRPRVIIHLSDAGMMSPAGEWGNVKTKTRRPLSTLALEAGVMDSLIQDVREFLDVEEWYAEAGIPHHRGYLLHGPPGTGKTSTIYALAGELGLEIYSLSLASSYIDDAYLQRLATAVPRGAILLIEDIDCAFPSREDEDGMNPADARRRGPGMISGTFMPQTMMPFRHSGVTLSGLLNVIDGVGSDEGRLFFATTNHYDRLDPALVRPGRVDVKLEYKKASQLQVRALFKRFFSPSRFDEASDSSIPASSGAFEKSDSSGLRHRRGPSGSFAEAPKPKRPLSVPLQDLEHRFARAVPEGEFSAAEIQGFLLDCKWDPEAAAEGAMGWVAKERAQRVAQVERENERKRKQKEKFMQESVQLDPQSTLPMHPSVPAYGNVLPPQPLQPVGGGGQGLNAHAPHPKELPMPLINGVTTLDRPLEAHVPASSTSVESDDSARTISTTGSYLNVGRPSPKLSDHEELVE